MTVRLGEILKIPSERGKSSAMEALVRKELIGLDGVTFATDRMGNIAATKGDGKIFSAFVCHMDVPFGGEEGFDVKRLDGGLWVGYYKKDGVPTQVQIGGDKVGVHLCLKLLRHLDNVKCVFFAQEVPDALGVKMFDLSFFDDCRWILGLDLSGNNKISTVAYGARIASKVFENDLMDVGRHHGYEVENLIVPHLHTLKDRPGLKISMAMISTGCWNPYEDTEHVVETHVNKAFGFCLHAHAKLETKYIHHWEDRLAVKQYCLPSMPTVAPKGLPDTWDKCIAIGCEVRVEKTGTYCIKCLNEIRGIGMPCSECDIPLFLEEEICNGKCQMCRRKHSGAPAMMFYP